jgi:hypothetical protein
LAHFVIGAYSLAAARALEAVGGAARDLATLPRDHRVFYGGIAAARLVRDLRIEQELGRGLHSSTFRLNFSAFCRIGVQSGIV